MSQSRLFQRALREDRRDAGSEQLPVNFLSIIVRLETRKKPRQLDACSPRNRFTLSRHALLAWRLFCLLRCDVFGVRCRNRAILFSGRRALYWQPWLRQRLCRSAYRRANHPSTDLRGDRRMSAHIREGSQLFPAAQARGHARPFKATFLKPAALLASIVENVARCGLDPRSDRVAASPE